jgi:hypothetical protein
VQQVLPPVDSTVVVGATTGSVDDTVSTINGTSVAGDTTAVPSQTTDPNVITVPGVSTVPPTAPPPTTPPAQAMPIAFGESVMLGAQPLLWAEGQGVYVNAAESRGTPGMLEAIAAETAAGRIGSIVVIQLGTNGNVSDESFDRVIAALPPTTTVYMMTVFGTKEHVGSVNARIFGLPARHPNVQIIDWAATAPTIALCPDSTHISCGTGAARVYANLVFAAIGKPELVK